MSTDPATMSEFGSQMAELARMLDEAGSLERALDAVTLAAVDLVDGAEFAGVTLRTADERLESVAATSPDTTTSDALQSELAEGPCVDATREELLLVTGDVERDERWPRWGPAVADLVSSVLSVQLVSTRGTHGALNVYSSRRDAFVPESIYAATALSIHAGAAMRAVVMEEDMRAGLASRLIIGQAHGILMHKFGLDQDAAHAVLRRYSQVTNTKVIALAHQLVADRGATFTRDVAKDSAAG